VSGGFASRLALAGALSGGAAVPAFGQEPSKPARLLADAGARLCVYELDVGVGTFEASALVGDSGESAFDAIVLWVAPDLPGSAALPVEPHARLFDPKALAPLEHDLGDLLAPVRSIRTSELAIAVGRRRVADVAKIPLVPVDHAIVLDEPDGSTRTIPRARRPAAQHYLWAASGGEVDRSDLRAISVSSRLTRSSSPELRSRQARLDVLSFSRLGPPHDPRLDAQSRLATSLADLLAGDDVEAFDPLENVWLEAPSARRLTALRRGDPHLDAEEWLFSVGRDGSTRVASALTPDGALVPSTVRDDDHESSSSRDSPVPDSTGALSRNDVALLLHAARLHREIASNLARHLATGATEPLETARRRVETSRDELAPLPSPFRDAWLTTLALDHDLLLAPSPWRVHSTTWSVTTPASAAATVEVARVDDPRLGAWAAPIEQALGGATIDLTRFVAVRPGAEVTLATEFSLVDPRSVRLRVAAAAARSIRLNGAVVVEPFDAARGPLLTTVALPAGRNTLEVVLTLDGTSGDVTLDLDRLPHRVEGTFLDPQLATRVTEPVVRLRDPSALGEQSLVWPRGRKRRGDDASDGKECEAAFPFTVGDSKRDDVWLHVLPRSDADGHFTLRVDDGTTQVVTVSRGNGWRWQRAPAPVDASHGDHALVVHWLDEELRLDQVVLLDATLTIPGVPRGDAPLSQSFWRYDPLGVGIVADLPRSDTGPLAEPSFTVERSGAYELLAWLKGTDPLAAGQTAELELAASSSRTRFVLPAGTPVEEWVSLGTVNLVAGERNVLRARGSGALARVAFVR
jgi:hypothetical protein